MASVSDVTSVLSKIGTGNLKGIKGLGLGSLLTAGICLFDFAEVPKAFKLKYNSKGEKVEGTNWKAGIKEFLKSVPKCDQMFILPTLITAAVAGAGPLVATLGGIAALAAPMGGYALLDKLLPHEEEEIKLICQEKGIDISGPEGILA